MQYRFFETRLSKEKMEQRFHDLIFFFNPIKVFLTSIQFENYYTGLFYKDRFFFKVNRFFTSNYKYVLSGYITEIGSKHQVCWKIKRSFSNLFFILLFGASFVFFLFFSLFMSDIGLVDFVVVFGIFSLFLLISLMPSKKEKSLLEEKLKEIFLPYDSN